MKLTYLCLALLIASTASTARAHDVHTGTYVLVEPSTLTPPPRAPRRDRPSVFTSGLRGLVVGGAAGLSIAYLAGGDGRDAGFAGGIGALSGAGLGVGIGLLDLGSEGGRAHLVMRDTLYGTLFGALTGAVTGGLFVIRSGEGEDVLLGTTIGVLAGAGLGLTVGLVEAFALRGERSCGRATCTAARALPTVGATADAHGQVIVTPGLAGRF